MDTKIIDFSFWPGNTEKRRLIMPVLTEQGNIYLFQCVLGEMVSSE